MIPQHSSPALGLRTYDRVFNTPERLAFASRDIDEARSLVTRILKPHTVSVLDPKDRLDARMHYATIGRLTLIRMHYGPGVSIACDPLENAFMVQMPLSGGGSVRSGSRRIDSTSQVASVLCPDHDTHMQWEPGTVQLLLCLPRSLAESLLAGHLGYPLDQPLRFELGFRWHDCIPWKSLLDYIVECLARYPDLDQHKLIVSQIQQLAASTLLSTHRHNYSDATPSRRSTILPRHVRRAQEYLEAHVQEDVSTDRLAQMVGVSVRSLYAGFKDFLGISPMHYLRDLRMERARADLMSGEACSISGVALRWGFTHMGRFSHYYRQRYDETPSQTLRRR